MNEQNSFDIVVVGGGPAGIMAAQSDKYSTPGKPLELLNNFLSAHFKSYYYGGSCGRRPYGQMGSKRWCHACRRCGASDEWFEWGGNQLFPVRR